MSCACKLLDVGYRNTADALHDHDLAAAVIPVHEGHVEIGRAVEVPTQLARVGGLAHQVELVHDGGFKLAHDLYRFDALGLTPVAVGHLGQQQQHFDVLANLCLDTRDVQS